MKPNRGHFDQSEFLKRLTVEERWNVLARVLYRLAWMQEMHPNDPHMHRFKKVARGRTLEELRIP